MFRSTLVLALLAALAVTASAQAGAVAAGAGAFGAARRLAFFHQHPTPPNTQNTQTKTPLLAAVGNLADAAATGAGALTNAAATFGSLVADPTQLLAFNGLLGAKGAVKA